MKQLTLRQFTTSKKIKKEIQRRLKLAEESVKVLKHAREIEQWILTKPITI